MILGQAKIIQRERMDAVFDSAERQILEMKKMNFFKEDVMELLEDIRRELAKEE